MTAGCQFQELPPLTPVAFEELPGWEHEDFHGAAEAWQASCRFFLTRQSDTLSSVPLHDWQKACRLSQGEDLSSAQGFKAFLKKHFKVYQIADPDRPEGLFTGYYEPILKGSYKPTDRYRYPIYRRPPELIVIEELGRFRPSLRGHRIAGIVEGGTLKPYFTREQIDKGALQNRDLELVWVDNLIDLFWMHIQGSGQIIFEDGTRLRIGYDGTNGYAFTAIGTEIRKRSGMSADKITMDSLKEWLIEHPAEQNEILWMNQSYVFFKELSSDTPAPKGRIEQPLVPLRSMAIDPVYIPSGAPLWLDAEGPLGTPRLQRLFFGHDVGGAIKGRVRGDVYWGNGDEAGHMAGAMKSKGRLYLMLPIASQDR